MTRVTTRTLRLLVLQTVASSLIVSEQNGHSIAATPDGNGTTARAWWPAAPARARVRRAACRASAAAGRVQPARIAAPPCRGRNSSRPAPARPFPCGRTDMASGRNLEHETGRRYPPFGILHIDPHQMVARRQLRIRHVDAGRLHE